MLPPASQIAVFPTRAGSTEGQKITIKFLNANKTAFVPIEILADTGSDITLISREDGLKLGFNPDYSQNKFGVGGVGEGAVGFSKFTTKVQIGNIPPVSVNLGVADKPNALRDNLLGRENILSQFDVTYREDSVSFIPRGQKAMACGMFTDGRGF